MTGGAVGGAIGTVSIFDPYQPDTELVALAIHVTDNSGDSHSLSSLNDPALVDIVADLNATSGSSGLIAYVYGAAPQIYAGETAALSAGEKTNSGQPFDILLTENSPTSVQPALLNWGFDFANEIGNTNGIVALNITDIAAIPEPSAFSLSFISLSVLLFITRRGNERRTGAAGSIFS